MIHPFLAAMLNRGGQLTKLDQQASTSAFGSPSALHRRFNKPVGSSMLDCKFAVLAARVGATQPSGTADSSLHLFTLSA
jgi:hypothetical protein